MLKAISPIEGRYHAKTKVLQDYFSEFALIKYRVEVEIQYLVALIELGLPQLKGLDKHQDLLVSIAKDFSLSDAETIKATEKITNHDVKAVEYFIKDKLKAKGLDKYMEWVHFGLTSQDINNTANPLMVMDFLEQVYYSKMDELTVKLTELAAVYKGIPMLARTHGQPASPTSVGKEIMVFVERLIDQLGLLGELPIKAKFGGATGNFNAHLAAFPTEDWKAFGDEFVQSLGMERSQYTTQISHYDHFAALFDNLARINTILIDFARDMWTYISMDYFKQKVIATEVGSSAMPHKVNPIDFENAEGNLGMANCVFTYLSQKLPISRLQRDLTDSTVSRNIGVPFAHTMIAIQSLLKGLSKVELNEAKLKADLENNWAVLAEAIQNILRREGYPKPYEALKALTRGNKKIDESMIKAFISSLDINESVRAELSALSPHTYIGYP